MRFWGGEVVMEVAKVQHRGDDPFHFLPRPHHPTDYDLPLTHQSSNSPIHHAPQSMLTML